MQRDTAAAAADGDWSPSEQQATLIAAILVCCCNDAARGSACSIEDAVHRAAATPPSADAALDRCLWPETGAALESGAAAGGLLPGLLWRVHQTYQTGGRRALLTLARRERRPGLAAYMDRAHRRCGWDWWSGGDGDDEAADDEALPEWTAAVEK